MVENKGSDSSWRIPQSLAGRLKSKPPWPSQLHSRDLRQKVLLGFVLFSQQVVLSLFRESVNSLESNLNHFLHVASCDPVRCSYCLPGSWKASAQSVPLNWELAQNNRRAERMFFVKKSSSLILNSKMCVPQRFTYNSKRRTKWENWEKGECNSFLSQ